MPRKSPSPSTPEQEQQSPRVIDAHEAGRLLRLDYYTVRRLALSGQLPLVRYPSVESLKGRKSPASRPIRRLLFDREDVLRFVEKCKEAV